jgi:hypothetical protein
MSLSAEQVVAWDDFDTIAKDKKTGMTDVKAAGSGLSRN